MLKERIFIVALLFVGLVSALHGQNITTFGVPNAVNTNPTDINAAGQIAGDFSGTDLVHHGFLRERNGHIITFDVPGSTDTFPTAIDLEGDVIGYSDGPDEQTGPLTVNTIRGFVRHRSGAITLFDPCGVSGQPPAPEAGLSFPQAVNAFGEIIGNCSQFVGIDTFDFAFVQQRNGTVTNPEPCGNPGVQGNVDAVALNIFGYVAGWCSTQRPGPKLGFLINPVGTSVTFNGNMGDPTELTETLPTAINGIGQITGSYTDVQGTEQAFLREPNGKIGLFSVNDALATNPQAIGPAGRIIGFWEDGNGLDHGFVRRENGKTKSFDVPGATSTNPVALKEGLITGHYSDANGEVRGFLVSIDELLFGRFF
jgi:hypothetical protein